MQDGIAFTLELKRIATMIRLDIIEMLQEAGSGHVGGALGMSDIYAALYFSAMKHHPSDPAWPDRDRLILSCGHTCPVRYAAMAEAGYFPRHELMSLRKFGTRLHGHPHNLALPGIETSSGPLGQGLSQAIGIALAAQMNHQDYHTFAVLSDGEHQEGQIWEAIMFAGNRHLNNLTAIVDRNFIQIDGPTESIMPLEPFAAKYRAFGWEVVEIEGNDMEAIVEALTNVRHAQDKPTCIMAHTVPGKGVSFMENDYHWHSKVMTEEQYTTALTELHAIQTELGGNHV